MWPEKPVLQVPGAKSRFHTAASPATLTAHQHLWSFHTLCHSLFPLTFYNLPIRLFHTHFANMPRYDFVVAEVACLRASSEMETRSLTFPIPEYALYSSSKKFANVIITQLPSPSYLISLIIS